MAEPRLSEDTTDSAHPDRDSRQDDGYPGQQNMQDNASVELVPTQLLLPADSPRTGGENEEHIQSLVDSGTDLPPIIVRRSTMRVVDGMHRLRAAIRRGETHIAVRFFDGTDRDTFVLAVQANRAHGLPLSAADRRAAAARIIDSHPEWSDRAIAAVVGLADKTVAAIRRRISAEDTQLDTRIGRDGRARPLNSAQGRQIASELIAQQPDAPLRQIATAAGISPGTARDVRERIRRGDNPVPPRQRHQRPTTPATLHAAPNDKAANDKAPNDKVRNDKAPSNRQAPNNDPASVDDRVAHLPRAGAVPLAWSLRRDPSLRTSEAGRALLRLAEILIINDQQRAELLNAVPGYQIHTVARVARECANAWHAFADQLERRHQATA